LTRERDRLINAQALKTFAFDGANRLYDEEGAVVEHLRKLLKEADHWGTMEPRFAGIARRLEGVLPEIEDLADTFRELADEFEADPERLDEVERRLQLIRKLEKKYQRTVGELIGYHATLASREAELRRHEEDLGGIEAELSAAFAELKSASNALSKQRAKVAKKLASETEKHLADLGMPDAKLDAVLTPVPLGDDPAAGELPASGIDHFELFLAANKGEPSLPLRKVASGGELSRTMLALKSMFALHDPAGTLIFDEIDANVGGRLGDVLGEKLAALSRNHQVICVTHLPQVASYAKHQWTIRKQTQGKRTITTIVSLTNEADRVEELAKMLRGEARGETTLQEARAMLKRAKAAW
jgi:DNA repair protein RecN (Recombination protein N)